MANDDLIAALEAGARALCHLGRDETDIADAATLRALVERAKREAAMAALDYSLPPALPPHQPSHSVSPDAP